MISTSLRVLIAEGSGNNNNTSTGRKALPAGTLRFNTDGGGGVGGSAAAARGGGVGYSNASAAARCHAVAWHPGTGGGFVSLHADGGGRCRL